MYELRKLDEFKTPVLIDFFKEIYPLKQLRIKKMVNKRRLKHAIIGEILLRKLLEKNGLSYKSLDFINNDQGKPYIKNNPIFFSISHSFLYVIVVTSYHEIGVDIEKVRKTHENVWHQFATETEKNYLFSSKKDIERRIFEIFCLKEAYFKMKGNNLNDAKSVEFYITQRGVSCSDKSVHAYFIKDLKDYVVAVCEKIN